MNKKYIIILSRSEVYLTDKLTNEDHDMIKNKSITVVNAKLGIELTPNGPVLINNWRE